MLGFHSISEAPFASLTDGEVSVVASLEVPVEIKASLMESRKIPVESLLEVLSTNKVPVEFLGSLLVSRKIPVDIKTDVVLSTFSLPIEVVGAKLDIEGLKWVLTSRNGTWEINSELLELLWSLDSRSSDWKL